MQDSRATLIWFGKSEEMEESEDIYSHDLP